jgi:hypothetical protein
LSFDNIDISKYNIHSIMDLDIHCSQSSLRSSSYYPTTIYTDTEQYTSSSYFRRIKKNFKKNFCCHRTRLSSSCLKCFRYFVPTKYKCECQFFFSLYVTEVFNLRHMQVGDKCSVLFASIYIYYVI